MEIVHLEKQSFDECVSRATEVLRRGGVVLYPTDTLYGLGADAFSDAAFARVCEIKERDERRPIHAVFADMEMARKYIETNKMGERLAKAFFPGPVTLVFEKKKELQSGIAKDLSTIGVRIPKYDFCITLARVFGAPYTTTSANKSGEESLNTIDEILAQLGKAASQIDLIIDSGTLAGGRSSVVDVRGEEPFILREGAISSDEIRARARGRAARA